MYRQNRYKRQIGHDYTPRGPYAGIEQTISGQSAPSMLQTPFCDLDFRTKICIETKPESPSDTSVVLLSNMYSNPRMLQSTRYIVFCAAILTTFLGLIVAIGWTANSTSLVQVLPQWSPMQFNTAFGFVMCGVALFFLLYRRWIPAAVCGGVVTFLGMAASIQYAFGIDLRIDQFFIEHHITVGTSQPGRMAPNSAFCFLLSGLAILIVNRSHSASSSSAAAGIIGAILVGLGTVAFFGYMTSIETAYAWGNMTQMAIHTSIGFVLVGTALIGLGWKISIGDHQCMPDWFPASMGVCVMTATICFWRALLSIESVPHALPPTCLIVGTILSVLTGATTGLAQFSHRRSKQLEFALNGLKREIEERRLTFKSLRSKEKELSALHTLQEIQELTGGGRILKPNDQLLSKVSAKSDALP